MSHSVFTKDNENKMCLMQGLKFDMLTVKLHIFAVKIL